VLLGLGTKLLLIAPVVALKATRFRRVRIVSLVALRTWEKLPPTTTVSPTWTMEYTVPSRMWGVKFAGSSLTISPGCGWVLPTDAPVAGGATNSPTRQASTTHTDAEILRTATPQTHRKT
jgi:hypothetical protein